MILQLPSKRVGILVASRHPVFIFIKVASQILDLESLKEIANGLAVDQLEWTGSLCYNHWCLPLIHAVQTTSISQSSMMETVFV